MRRDEVRWEGQRGVRCALRKVSSMGCRKNNGKGNAAKTNGK